MTISLRRMTIDDIELGMQLKQQAGWNQTASDWRRFLELEPEGCFVAAWDGRDVATTTTCVFHSVGWIAMVLVDESHRHRGIATRLVERAVEYLTRRSVTTIRLDATQFGRPVYSRMGFAVDFELARFHGTVDRLPPDATHRTCQELISDLRLEAILHLDHHATATSRKRLIEHLIRAHPQNVRLTMRPTSETGFLMFRPGSEAAQIGPVVALDPHDGTLLGDWALDQCRGSAVFIDIPLKNSRAVEWAYSRGLTEQRRFWRMSRGRPLAEQPTILWASSGPENG